MGLVENVDYVFAPQVWDITNDGVFLGTKAYLFFFPTKITNHQHRRIETITFSFEGEPVSYYIEALLKASGQTLDKLHAEILELQKETPEIVAVNIAELTGLKVQAGFFGSGITIKRKEGKFGWSPFCQKLGAHKKLIKTFYS